MSKVLQECNLLQTGYSVNCSATSEEILSLEKQRKKRIHINQLRSSPDILYINECSNICRSFF